MFSSIFFGGCFATVLGLQFPYRFLAALFIFKEGAQETVRISLPFFGICFNTEHHECMFSNAGDKLNLLWRDRFTFLY